MLHSIWRFYLYISGFWLFDIIDKFSKFRGRQSHFTFYRSIDLMFSILIIGILMPIAITQYLDYKKRAVMIHATGFKGIMEQVHVYHSLTGEWPDDEDTLTRYTQFKQLMPVANGIIDSYQVDHGAVHFKYTEKLDGKILTFRPAVTSDDPYGPVIWLAGEKTGRSDWLITGKDKTTVDSYMINRYLR